MPTAKQRPHLQRNRRRAQHRQRHQQAADARQDQDEDQELVEVEGEEGRHGQLQVIGQFTVTMTVTNDSSSGDRLAECW